MTHSPSQGHLLESGKVSEVGKTRGPPATLTQSLLYALQCQEQTLSSIGVTGCELQQLAHTTLPPIHVLCVHILFLPSGKVARSNSIVCVSWGWDAYECGLVGYLGPAG